MAPIPGHEEESIYRRLRRRIRSRSRRSSSDHDGQSDAGASSNSNTLPEMSAHSVLETLKHVNSIHEQHLAYSSDSSTLIPHDIPGPIRSSPSIVASNNSGDSELSGGRGKQSMENTNAHMQEIPPSGATHGGHIDNAIVSTDVWSVAFREAIDGLGAELDVAILKGRHIEQLFKELEEIDEKATQESAFLRGLKHLHAVRVPLETFKLALDVTSPVAAFEPVSSTVFGVVRSVTAVAISLASADLEFAKQIGEMLEQISYIDDCDTLGQKSNQKDIHNALVSVYRKILEFYKVAFEILTKKGARLAMRMVLERDHLPEIVQDFLKRADTLRKLVQKSTWEIVEDVRSMLYGREISRWLHDEKMTRQCQYHADVCDLRSDEACEFLLTDPKFLEWYHATDSSQLVILGDMGSGKTVATAYLIDELIKRNKHQLPQPKICYYYCRDDETGRAVYIFSALLLSLLKQLPGLQKPFYEWYKEAQASGNLEPATDWKKLQEYLQKAVETLDRPLFIVIDGLDECDGLSRKSLLELLRDLGQRNPRLKTVLSSRPEEDIVKQLSGSLRIDVIPSMERDRIIVAHTVERELSRLSQEVKSLIIERLSRLAQGSAIWTKMTVELIKVGEFRAIRTVRRFLDTIYLPPELSKLYSTLLSRCTSNNEENMELAIVALRLLAVSRRPLSMLELAWATALATAGPEVTTVAALDELVDHERLLRFIRPFITRIDFDDNDKRQVRLVHLSVTEFLNKNLESSHARLGHQALSVAAAHRSSAGQEDGSEAWILNICLRYLLLDEIGSISLFPEEQVAMEELPQIDLYDDDGKPSEFNRDCSWEEWEETMDRFDPAERGFGKFFVYASCQWPEHFGAVQAETRITLSNIERICQPGSVRLQNWTGQYTRPECAIKPRFTFDCEQYDPLSITALYGSDELFSQILETSDLDNYDNFCVYSAMMAVDKILKWGDLARLKVLFENSKIGQDVHSLDFFRLVIAQWSDPSIDRGTSWIKNFALLDRNEFSDQPGDDWNPVFDLVLQVLDTMVEEQWANELLCIAARAGCMPIVERLMSGAQLSERLMADLLDVRTSLSGLSIHHQSIGQAVVGNHVEVVEYLLKQPGIERHLMHCNSHDQNVLHAASLHCNPAMYRLLGRRFPSGTFQPDKQNKTPYELLMESGSPSCNEAAKALLFECGNRGDYQVSSHGRDLLRIRSDDTPVG